MAIIDLSNLIYGANDANNAIVEEWDASGNAFPTGIEGRIYVVTAAGVVNSVTYDVGESVIYKNGSFQSLGIQNTVTTDGRAWVKRTFADNGLVLVAGDALIVDTSGGAPTYNLPASATAGDRIYIQDYISNFSTSNLTIGRNGHNINGAASDLVLSTDNLSLELYYVDVTEGWISFTRGDSVITLGQLPSSLDFASLSEANSFGGASVFNGSIDINGVIDFANATVQNLSLGASASTDLTDMPASLSGEAGKVLKVNVGETGYELSDASGIAVATWTPTENGSLIGYQADALFRNGGSQDPGFASGVLTINAGAQAGYGEAASYTPTADEEIGISFQFTETGGIANGNSVIVAAVADSGGFPPSAVVGGQFIWNTTNSRFDVLLTNPFGGDNGATVDSGVAHVDDSTVYTITLNRLSGGNVDGKIYVNGSEIVGAAHTFTTAQPATLDGCDRWGIANAGAAPADPFGIRTTTDAAGTATILTESTFDGTVDVSSYPASPRANLAYEVTGVASTLTSLKGDIINGDIVVFGADESLSGIINDASLPDVTVATWTPNELSGTVTTTFSSTTNFTPNPLTESTEYVGNATDAIAVDQTVTMGTSENDTITYYFELPTIAEDQADKGQLYLMGSNVTTYAAFTAAESFGLLVTYHADDTISLDIRNHTTLTGDDAQGTPTAGVPTFVDNVPYLHGMRMALKFTRVDVGANNIRLDVYLDSDDPIVSRTSTAGIWGGTQIMALLYPAGENLSIPFKFYHTPDNLVNNLQPAGLSYVNLSTSYPADRNSKTFQIEGLSSDIRLSPIGTLSNGMLVLFDSGGSLVAKSDISDVTEMEEWTILAFGGQGSNIDISQYPVNRNGKAIMARTTNRSESFLEPNLNILIGDGDILFFNADGELAGVSFNTTKVYNFSGGDDFVAAVAATAGIVEIDYSASSHTNLPSAGLGNVMTAGFAGNIEATVTVDGGGNQAVNVSYTPTSTTWQQLLDGVNLDITGATASFVGDALRITSDTTGASSTVTFADFGPNQFSTFTNGVIQSPVDGIDGVAGVTASPSMTMDHNLIAGGVEIGEIAMGTSGAGNNFKGKTVAGVFPSIGITESFPNSPAIYYTSMVEDGGGFSGAAFHLSGVTKESSTNLVASMYAGSRHQYNLPTDTIQVYELINHTPEDSLKDQNWLFVDSSGVHAAPQINFSATRINEEEVSVRELPRILQIQTNNTQAPVLGHGNSYILTDVGNLHANFGTISGVSDNDVVRYNSVLDTPGFEISFSASANLTGGATTYNVDDDNEYLWTGSAWEISNHQTEITDLIWSPTTTGSEEERPLKFMSTSYDPFNVSSFDENSTIENDSANIQVLRAGTTGSNIGGAWTQKLTVGAGGNVSFTFRITRDLFNIGDIFEVGFTDTLGFTSWGQTNPTGLFIKARFEKTTASNYNVTLTDNNETFSTQGITIDTGEFFQTFALTLDSATNTNYQVFYMGDRANAEITQAASIAGTLKSNALTKYAYARLVNITNQTFDLAVPTDLKNSFFDWNNVIRPLGSYLPDLLESSFPSNRESKVYLVDSDQGRPIKTLSHGDIVHGSYAFFDAKGNLAGLSAGGDFHVRPRIISEQPWKPVEDTVQSLPLFDPETPSTQSGDNPIVSNDLLTATAGDNYSSGNNAGVNTYLSEPVYVTDSQMLTYYFNLLDHDNQTDLVKVHFTSEAGDWVGVEFEKFSPTVTIAWLETSEGDTRVQINITSADIGASDEFALSVDNDGVITLHKNGTGGGTAPLGTLTATAGTPMTSDDIQYVRTKFWDINNHPTTAPAIRNITGAPATTYTDPKNSVTFQVDVPQETLDADFDPFFGDGRALQVDDTYLHSPHVDSGAGDIFDGDIVFLDDSSNVRGTAFNSNHSHQIRGDWLFSGATVLNTTVTMEASPTVPLGIATKDYVDLGNKKAVYATFDFNDVGVINIGATIPENSIVTKVSLNVTTAFDGTPSVIVGTATDDDGAAVALDTDLTTIDKNYVDAFFDVGSDTQLIATLSATAPSVGDAQILIEYYIPTA